MIVKIPIVLVLVIFIKDITSVSLTKVYMQNGPDYPAEYVQYGTPVSYSPQIAQISAAPIGSVAPYSSNYVPCGTPCVWPSPVAAPVASVVPSASIVQYQSPGLPVVVAKSTKPSGYAYSYSVYDEQTGDHKTQQEISDGSLVRGGYSFLQPDGFIRDVQYVADDMQGFNAVVKNYLPVIVETKKPDATEKPQPGPADKSDNLKVDESKKTEKVPSPAVKEPILENLKEDSHAELPPAADQNKPQEVPHDVKEKPHEAQELHNATPKPKEIPQTVYEIAYVTFDAEAKVSEDHTKPTEKPKSPIEPEVSINTEQNTIVTGQDLANSNVFVPYNDIIKCIQAAFNGAQTSSAQKPESPLTYIILNKAC